MKQVEIYTDGACSGNPGPGGYGTILVFNGVEKELSEGFADTTNNRMELMAAIRGLEALKEPCSVKITTDSQYLADSVNKGWAKSWRAKGWKKSDNKMALNTDLWEKFLDLLDRHEVEIIWVRGHDGHEYNERCDVLAVEATKQAQKFAEINQGNT